MTEQLQVPEATEAEAMTAALIVSNARRASGLDLCDESDFYNPAFARLFQARAELAQIKFLDDRVARAAAITGLSEAAVNRLISALPVMWSGGRFARQVREAADRRRAMGVLAKAYNKLGTGGTVDKVKPMLEGLP